MAKGSYRHYEGFRDHEKHEKGGIVKISGAFLLDHEDDILNLVKKESQVAEGQNPEHRVTKIEKIDGRITVQVSEHTLASHIGKSLSRAYKGELETKYHEGEMFSEVSWKRD